MSREEAAKKGVLSIAFSEVEGMIRIPHSNNGVGAVLSFPNKMSGPVTVKISLWVCNKDVDPREIKKGQPGAVRMDESSGDQVLLDKGKGRLVLFFDRLVNEKISKSTTFYLSGEVVANTGATQKMTFESEYFCLRSSKNWARAVKVLGASAPKDKDGNIAADDLVERLAARVVQLILPLIKSKYRSKKALEILSPEKVQSLKRATDSIRKRGSAKKPRVEEEEEDDEEEEEEEDS